MLCKHCQKNQATTHIKRTVNGHTEEFYLCGECAEKLGFTAPGPLSMSDLWGSLFSAAGPARTAPLQCKQCGYTFDDIAATGKMGCPDCYETFYDRLLPSIQKIHGKVSHVGTQPENLAGKSPHEPNDPSLEQLKAQLKQAVEEENFEKAAELRDAIKNIGEGEKQ